MDEFVDAFVLHYFDCVKSNFKNVLYLKSNLKFRFFVFEKLHLKILNNIKEVFPLTVL